MQKNRVVTLLILTNLAVLGATGFSASRAFGADILETLDATRIEGKLKSITDKQVVFVSGGVDKVFPVSDVAGITLGLSTDVMKAKGRQIVTTVSGHLFVTRKLLTKEENVVFGNSLLGDISIDFGRVSDLILPKVDFTPESVINRCKRRGLVAENVDMLIIERSDGNWVGAEGTFLGLTVDDVLFLVGGVERKKVRTACPAVRFSSLTKPTPTVGTIIGKRGTRVNFTSLTFKDTEVAIDAPGIGARKIDLKNIARIILKSDRVVKLADVEPAKVKEYGFFDKSFKYRSNLAVSGKPITLDGKIYPSGLGVHSFCELTYNLDKKFVKFVSMVGIDDSVKPLGDAEIVFLCDGKVVKKIRVQGKDKPVNVIVNVKGAKEFTIRVDFGADGLGVSDHVDFAGARLLK